MISQGGGTRGEPGIGSVAATGALEQLLDQLIGEAVPCGTRHALWHDDDHVPSLQKATPVLRRRALARISTSGVTFGSIGLPFSHQACPDGNEGVFAPGG